VYSRCLGRLPDPCLGLDNDRAGGINSSTTGSPSAFSRACRFKILFSRNDVVIFLFFLLLRLCQYSSILLSVVLGFQTIIKPPSDRQRVAEYMSPLLANTDYWTIRYRIVGLFLHGVFGENSDPFLLEFDVIFIGNSSSSFVNGRPSVNVSNDVRRSCSYHEPLTDPFGRRAYSAVR